MRALEIGFAVGWLLFWGYWLVAALNSKTSIGRTPRYLGVRLAAAAVVVVLIRTNVLNARNFFLTDPALQAVGLALFALGLGIAVWARVYLGRNWGMPMSEKEQPELVTSGPYRYVRHPIYSGIILALIGTALGIGVVFLVIAALTGAYFIYSATVEDETMARRFPAAYPDYKRSTRMLVPFLI